MPIAIVMRQDGRIVGGASALLTGAARSIYDPWHYVPVLARKPGALRNGAPFKDWVLPAGAGAGPAQARRSDDGDRQMVNILAAVLDRRAAGGRGRLRPGAVRGRPFGRRRSSTSSRVGAIPDRRRRSSPPTRCGCATRRSPTAPDTTNSGAPDHGKNRSPRHDERTQALRHESAYDEIAATALKRKHEPQRFVGDLPEAEISEKQARSIRYQLAIAKLPLAKDVDDFVFKNTPINEALVRDLAGGAFIAQQRNVVLVGGTEPDS